VDKLLTQEQLKELVSVTAETLRIKYPSIIEKDYYVTHVIHSLSGIENEYFRLKTRRILSLFYLGCRYIKKEMKRRNDGLGTTIIEGLMYVM